jgi:flagellar biogenesis protein FliO
VVFADQISALIFALILIGVVVYIVMSRFVTGPISELQRGEAIVIVASIIGMMLVVVYAAVELLLHIVF